MWKSICGVNESKIVVIEDGIAIEPVVEEKIVLKGQIRRRFTFGCVGLLTNRKRQAILLEAFRLVVDELVLLDPDTDRLEAVGGLAGRILGQRGWGGDLAVPRRLCARTGRVHGHGHVVRLCPVPAGIRPGRAAWTPVAVHFGG